MLTSSVFAPAGGREHLLLGGELGPGMGSSRWGSAQGQEASQKGNEGSERRLGHLSVVASRDAALLSLCFYGAGRGTLLM